MIINGLKAFYQMVLQSHLLDELHQPKRPKTLPNILNHDEILAICSSIKNRKHRCMIAMMYGSGLRLHELVNLKVKDIDFENVRLVVRTTNGNKARLTILSEKLVDTLRLYMKNKTPNDHVFTSSLNKKYSKRTVQCILEKALQAANIGKHASCHVLRHSFATHLLEDGVSVVTIQKLLGHTSVKTTMIYTRLARHSLGDIKSPL
jgi:site-specific recombinase XerD